MKIGSRHLLRVRGVHLAAIGNDEVVFHEVTDIVPQRGEGGEAVTPERRRHLLSRSGIGHIQ
jgi:hypothetical protein